MQAGGGGKHRPWSGKPNLTSFEAPSLIRLQSGYLSLSPGPSEVGSVVKWYELRGRMM